MKNLLVLVVLVALMVPGTIFAGDATIEEVCLSPKDYVGQTVTAKVAQIYEVRHAGGYYNLSIVIKRGMARRGNFPDGEEPTFIVNKELAKELSKQIPVNDVTITFTVKKVRPFIVAHYIAEVTEVK